MKFKYKVINWISTTVVIVDEYPAIYLDPDLLAKLNELGEEGWQVVDSSIYIRSGLPRLDALLMKEV